MTDKIEGHAVIVVFGATGDLVKKKLIPALYNLYAKKIIARRAPIIGVARGALTKDEFVKLLRFDEFIPNGEKKTLSGFQEQIYYLSLDLGESRNCTDFAKLVQSLGKRHGSDGNILFYLALPPSLFESAVGVVESSGSLEAGGWKRIAFEKPFGYDLGSARALNDCIVRVFQERDIYRIDHYLAKELVQTILVLRFANSIFEEIWNHKFVDNVQITVAEKIGVETRGNYYDKAGAVRDIVQNHLLQILALVSMEPPKSLNADHIRDEKVEVLKALKKIQPGQVVIGQYGEGVVEEEKVLPYREEKFVSPRSETETYAALKVYIHSKRWKGVPFYLRTGKRLAASFAQVNLVLKDAPRGLFLEQESGPAPNVITIRIQPDEGVAIEFNAKHPGYGMKLHPATMEFCRPCQFDMNSPEAYENLLHEILRGDQTLFTRWDGVKASWEFVDPVLQIIKNRKKDFPDYEAGNLGPSDAERLIVEDGRKWCLPRKRDAAAG